MPLTVSISTNRLEGFLGQDVWAVSLSLPGLQKSRLLGATKKLVSFSESHPHSVEQQDPMPNQNAAHYYGEDGPLSEREAIQEISSMPPLCEDDH